MIYGLFHRRKAEWAISELAVGRNRKKDSKWDEAGEGVGSKQNETGMKTSKKWKKKTTGLGGSGWSGIYVSSCGTFSWLKH